MYVCLCNGYRESQIRNRAQEGHTTAAGAYHALGNGPRCGKCLNFAQTLIDEEHHMLESFRAAAE